MSDFREAYDALKASQKDTNGIMINYSVEIITADGDTQSESLSLKSSGGKTMVKSNDVTLYQDLTTMVAFQQNEKTIFITKPLPGEWKKSQLSGVFQQQDSLLRYLSLAKCSEEMIGNQKFQKLVFNIVGTLKKSGVKTVVYWLNNKSIKSVLIEYAETAFINSWKMTIERLDINYSKDPFFGSAISQAMDKGNKVKELYKGYSVIDNRTK